MALKLVEERKITPEEKNIWQKGERDFRWMAEHSHGISEEYKGKYVAVVSQEIFAADTEEEVIEKVEAKYPDTQVFPWRIPYKREVWIL